MIRKLRNLRVLKRAIYESKVCNLPVQSAQFTSLEARNLRVQSLQQNSY